VASLYRRVVEVIALKAWAFAAWLWHFEDCPRWQSAELMKEQSGKPVRMKMPLGAWDYLPPFFDQLHNSN
jgi:hypothetical protein